MKIKELKDLLNSLPSEMDSLEVWCTMSSGCCGDFEELGLLEVDERLPSKDDPGMLRIHFNESLPGYRSCRQVSQTKDNDKEYWLKFPSSSYGKMYKGDKS